MTQEATDKLALIVKANRDNQEFYCLKVDDGNQPSLPYNEDVHPKGLL